MATERELREKLRKISALFEGATTSGERVAAAAAIERVRQALAALQQTEQPIEMQFSVPDRWQRRLFVALCRRYGIEPFRYRRQRYSTVVVRAPRTFIDRTLWPEFCGIKEALDEYLNEATERNYREELIVMRSSRAQRLNYTFRNISTAFNPPKAKELESAYSHLHAGAVGDDVEVALWITLGEVHGRWQCRSAEPAQ